MISNKVTNQHFHFLSVSPIPFLSAFILSMGGALPLSLAQDSQSYSPFSVGTLNQAINVYEGIYHEKMEPFDPTSRSWIQGSLKESNAPSSSTLFTSWDSKLKDDRKGYLNFFWAPDEKGNYRLYQAWGQNAWSGSSTPPEGAVLACSLEYQYWYTGTDSKYYGYNWEQSPNYLLKKNAVFSLKQEFNDKSNNNFEQPSSLNDIYDILVNKGNGSTIPYVENGEINDYVYTDYHNRLNLKEGQTFTIKNSSFIANYFNDSDTNSNHNSTSVVISVDSGATLTMKNVNFVGNYTQPAEGSIRGSCIYNQGTITGISGNFIGNYITLAEGGTTGPSGGAIFNTNNGEIGDIKGYFVGNHIYSKKGRGLGGVIGNQGIIQSISGVFIGNYTGTGNNDLPVMNEGTADDIGRANSGVFRNYSDGDYIAILGKYKNENDARGEDGKPIDFKGDYNFNAELIDFNDDGELIFNESNPYFHIALSGVFIGNWSVARGGVMFNNGEIHGIISGDFIGNYLYAHNGAAQGGAIANDSGYKANLSKANSSLSTIIGSFTGNYAYCSADSTYAARGQNAEGGAIYNRNATIYNIVADFSHNYAVSEYAGAYGGAIFNVQQEYRLEHDDISGNGIGIGDSIASGNDKNVATLGNIGFDEEHKAKFIGNYAKGKTVAAGGAIYLSTNYDGYDMPGKEEDRAKIGKTLEEMRKDKHAIMKNVFADFTGNYVESSGTNSRAEGGAIYISDYSEMLNTHGKFEENSAKNSGDASESIAKGGAFYIGQGATVGKVTADFIGNYVESSGTNSQAEGGAIYISDSATMDDVKGKFEGNSAKNSGDASESIAKGGAFYIGQGATVGKVTANFIGNSVWGSGAVRGGAMLVTKGATLGQISSLNTNLPTFQGNSALGNDADEKYLINGIEYSTLADVPEDLRESLGDSINSLYQYQNTNVFGGALRFDDSFIANLSADFDSNVTNGSGGALSNTEKGFIYQVSGNFTNNTAGVDGGAVHNLGTIGFLGKIRIQTDEGSDWKSELSENDYLNIVRDENGVVRTESDATSAENKFHYKEYDGSIRGGFVNTNFTGNVVNNIIHNNGNRGHGAAIYTTDDLFITVTEGKELNLSGNIVYYYDTNDKKPEDTVMTSEEIADVEGLADAIKAEGLNEEYVRALNTAIYVDNLGQDQTDPKTVYLVANSGGTMTISDAIRGQEVTTGGFVLRLRGYTDKEEASIAHHWKDTERGAIKLSGPIAEAYVIMDDVRLSIGTCINKFTFGTSSDLNKYRYATDTYQYGRSDVFRRAHLSVRSGLVDLTDDIDEETITQFAFGTLTSYGRGYLYKDNAYADGPAPESVAKSYDDTTFARWRVNVDLTRQAADLITTFEIRSSQNGEILPDAKGNLQMSNGRITLDQVTVSNIYDEFQNKKWDIEIKEGQTIKIQVLNLYVMNEKGELVDDYTSLIGADGKQIDYTTSTDTPIQLDDAFEIVEWESNKMDSNSILAKAVRLATTRTYNDSIEFVGWRNALAAWAELTDDEKNSRYTNVGWEWDGKEEKVFTLKGNYELTRDVEDLKSKGKDAEKNGSVYGDTWTITGERRDYTLNMQKQDLLTKVLQDQNARLENFRLVKVNGNSIRNDGAMFTLDSMSLEDELTITNNTNLTVTGQMTINNTITSAEDDKGEMIIENSSNKHEQTEITITGTVQNQNITHLESPIAPAAAVTEVTEQSPATVTNLQTSNTDGTPTQAFRNFTGNSLTMVAGQFNLFDMALNRLPLVNLTVNGGKINVASSTVDLTHKTMGGIDASGVAQMGDGSTGIIWLDAMQVIGDGEGYVTHVVFVPEGVGDAVQDNGIRNTTVKGAVHYYEVTYNDTEKMDNEGQTGKNGTYTFTRIPDRVTPETQTPAVDTLLGGYASMLQVYDYAFEHADLFSTTMANTRRDRYDEYSIVTPVKGYKEGAVDAAPSISPCPSNRAGLQNALWVRPYATFEKMPLNNGPKVDTNLYGALVGGDSALRERRGGWADVTSIYAAYMGSTKRYEGIRSRDNGLGLGITETLYRGNFYTALTATAATSFGSARTSYGNEKHHMLMGGVASRTGYNITLGSCRYVLQPTLLMSYTVVNVGDYTNAAGVRMEGRPMQVFQLHPYVKAVAHTDCGWDPYITVGYVHNFMGKTKFRANGERIPELSIDPYVEYSLGVQKTWRDKYTLYGQATGRHGGRNGAEVSVGIRWTW